MIKIIICDDHQLIRKAVISNLLPNTIYTVIHECANGKQLLETLENKNHPDIVLLDVSMKEMNGYETTIAISKKYPLIKVLGFSVFHSPQTVKMMLQFGAVGFLSKNSDIEEIKEAINQIYHKGIYYNQYVTQQMFKDIKNNKHNNNLTKKEIDLLPFLCDDTTYKKIASDKSISIKTIDRHKENICKKMNIKTRVGLTALAAKMGLIN